MKLYQTLAAIVLTASPLLESCSAAQSTCCAPDYFGPSLFTHKPTLEEIGITSWKIGKTNGYNTAIIDYNPKGRQSRGVGRLVSLTGDTSKPYQFIQAYDVKGDNQIEMIMITDWKNENRIIGRDIQEWEKGATPYEQGYVAALVETAISQQDQFEDRE